MANTCKKPETKVVTIVHDYKLMAPVSGPTQDSSAEFNDGLSRSFDFFSFEEEEEAPGKSDDDDDWEDWEEEE